MNKLSVFMACCVLIALTVLIAPVAGADEIGVLREEIRKQQELLIKQQQAMDQLMMKLKELEEKQKSYETKQKALADKTQAMEESQADDRDTVGQAMRDLRSRYGINLAAFGDLTYSSHSRERANNTFSLGEFSLYSTAHYGDRLNFLAEIEVEMEEDETGIEMERLWVGYTVDDRLTIRGGKHNSALGYWNKTYHRGKQLFSTVDRPFFLVSEHEGSILPLHIIGLELEGSLRTRLGRFKYEFEVGNGPGIDPVRKQHPNNHSDDNNSKQVVLRLSTRPSIAEWLNLGVFGTTYEVKTTEKKHLQQSVMGFDASINRSNFEFISEYFRLRNSRGSGDAFYVQLGYTFKKAFTPYVRYEYLSVDDDDPYFRALEMNNDRKQAIVGLRYDIDPQKSSIKVQYRYDKERHERTYNVIETQWAFSF